MSRCRRDDKHPFSTPVSRFEHQSVFVARSTRRRGKCHRILNDVFHNSTYQTLLVRVNALLLIGFCSVELLVEDSRQKPSL
ncbi:hypothetical protein ACTXT7_013447 [Hymenolepis weldensis]